MLNLRVSPAHQVDPATESGRERPTVMISDAAPKITVEESFTMIRACG